MSQDKCTIQVNGVGLEARPGQMLIEVTDAAGIYVPRFCYHSKLSVAANCRMCLVEVENAPKPLPACATPVTPGMKVHTKSVKAIGAQKATMEFLLINHPLDCPICDQGGECELQDLAMGFGRDVSRYTERKRVVRDKNIGPLVSTDMTRCIHCTRCVRFTEEVAGYQELGTIGRGDRVEISPYLERSVDHELSGNIIDLCPVGALNSKPYRFSARAWEMSQHPTVAPHDCLGTNLYAHVMDGRVKRIVPRPCEAINETWIADRDRFSYEGIYAADRLRQPMLRDGDDWRCVGWDEALDAVARAIAAATGGGRGADIGALVSPNATVEEGYLLSRLMAHLGSANLDHRLRRRDFRSQATEPLFPWLGMDISAVEGLEQVLIVGSNIRSEVPLLAHRLRKAALGGAGVHFLNPAIYPYLFQVGEYLSGEPSGFWLELGSLVRAAVGKSKDLRPEVASLVAKAPAPGERHARLCAGLRSATRSAIFLGHISQRHRQFAEIELLAAEFARLTGSSLGYVSEGANAAGLALAGVLPHRDAGGRARTSPGLSAPDMLQAGLGAVLLFGVEPDADCSDTAQALEGLSKTRFVVACTSFLTDALRRHAQVMLPLATFAETSGTFVNVEGRWQSFGAVAKPVGEARPGWKVLRVLANRLGVPGVGFNTSEAVRDGLRQGFGDLRPDNSGLRAAVAAAPAAGLVSLEGLDVPMYRVDALVRRSRPLQQTRAARTAAGEIARHRRA
jgi:NADH-quinone oxidoreductase subunit G